MNLFGLAGLGLGLGHDPSNILKEEDSKPIEKQQISEDLSDDDYEYTIKPTIGSNFCDHLKGSQLQIKEFKNSSTEIEWVGHKKRVDSELLITNYIESVKTIYTIDNIEIIALLKEHNIRIQNQQNTINSQQNEIKQNILLLKEQQKQIDNLFAIISVLQN